MIFIKGCPRSGTMFIAEYLQMVGFDIGHEELYKDGLVAWQYTPLEVDKSKHVVAHQVRHPLRCIESCFSLGSHSLKILSSFCDLKGKSTIDFMKMWVQWNETGERLSQFTYRIEDQIHVLLDAIHKNPLTSYSGLSTNSRRNKKKYKMPHLTFGALRKESKLWAGRVKECAQRYGYEL